MSTAAALPGRYAGGSPATRTSAALISAALVSGIALSMIFGLSRGLVAPPKPVADLVTLNFTLPKPPPEPEPPPRASSASAAKDAASARNIRNKATPVVAQPPRIPVPPPPIAAATAPAAGDARQSGASTQAGPGQGAGGVGSGTGGGGLGGDGDGGGIATGPRQVRGRLTVADFPDGLIGPGQQASVGVRYTVEIDGRVTGCSVLRSSGFSQVDALACRLITQRFRYRPATNRAGQPVRAVITESHTWYNRG